METEAKAWESGSRWKPRGQEQKQESSEWKWTGLEKGETGGPSAAVHSRATFVYLFFWRMKLRSEIGRLTDVVVGPGRGRRRRRQRQRRRRFVGVAVGENAQRIGADARRLQADVGVVETGQKPATAQSIANLN